MESKHTNNSNCQYEENDYELYREIVTLENYQKVELSHKQKRILKAAGKKHHFIFNNPKEVCFQNNQEDFSEESKKLIEIYKGKILEYKTPVPTDITILWYYGLLNCTDPNLPIWKKTKNTAFFVITDMGHMYLYYLYQRYILRYVPMLLSAIAVILSFISLIFH